jgi:hypothetical protein
MLELTDSFIKKTIEEIESAQNRARKRQEWTNSEIYEGNLSKYVKNRVIEMFPQTGKTYTITDYSILKKIVDKKAKAYKENPIRKLENPTETENYNAIVDEGDLNSAMKLFDKYINQHKYACIMALPEYKDDSKEFEEFKFMPLAPYEFDVVKNGEGDVECLILSYPDKSIKLGTNLNLSIAMDGDGNEECNEYVFWTEKEHRTFRAKIKRDVTSCQVMAFEEIIISDNGVNPFGVIPAVFAPCSYSPNYPVASPLPSQTVELNALLSIYLTSGSMQIGQLVLKYPSDQQITHVTHGLMNAMKLPQSKNPDDPETSAEYLSPTPDLAGQRESIVTYMNMILDEQGINSNQVTNPNEKFNSGFDRLLSMADVQGIIEENQETYREVEQELFEIIKQISSTILGVNYVSSGLSIIYKKPRVLSSDSEKLDNIKKMIDLGLLEEWEKFMVADPNLTELEAKDKMNKIEQEKINKLNSLGASSQDVFNGAQVSSIVEVANQVASGVINRETGANIVSLSFSIPLESALTMMPSEKKIEVEKNTEQPLEKEVINANQ